MTWLKKIGAAALVLAIALPALALDLDEARAKGKLGERSDGYVAAVDDSPSQEVSQLAEQVNAQRRAHYAEIAKKTGAPVEAVAALAGQKLIANRPSGEWVHDGSGWKKKP
ncbi:MAG TPA: YdbL family protein [Myxococcota bacterium]|nr:YdbL family protein [Myxococcota bacterium]